VEIFEPFFDVAAVQFQDKRLFDGKQVKVGMIRRQKVRPCYVILKCQQFATSQLCIEWEYFVVVNIS